jgi:integrase/recombinase XerD
MNPKLWEQIEAWRSTFAAEPSRIDWLFPSKRDATKHFPRRTVDQALRVACKKIGVLGVSTHSFRRSALTAASSKGVPLRVIQSISGHSSLDVLQRYLSVSDNQKKEAALAFD